MTGYQMTTITPNNIRYQNVVALVSGKGGSGKTTCATSMAAILAAANVRVLLVDFDLVTNGASYFFIEDLRRQGQLGLIESLGRDSAKQRLDMHPEYNSLIVEVQRPQLPRPFYFLASKSDFRSKDPAVDRVQARDPKEILAHLLDDVAQEYEVVLLDCQAGATQSAAAAAGSADRVVIVSEHDQISSDAVDNLLIRMGELFSRHMYLLNKVYIKESKDYQVAKEWFGGLNRLPPLPFGFDIRVAFGSRQIPVNTREPSAYFFALFEATKALFPEMSTQLQTYQDEVVEGQFAEFSENITSLVEERDRFRKELVDIGRQPTIQIDTITVGVLSGLVAVASIAVTFAALVYGLQLLLPILVGVFGAIGGIGGLVFSLLRVWRTRREAVLREERAKVEKSLGDVERDIDMYRSLLATKSEALLFEYAPPPQSREPLVDQD